ncbi:hypothetical protein BX600DRAFT_468336 [Xylariales sp. PMI_506]|nr:hypothetical protein BX600DRAFT_468336 [Xylariales sp. PMI_506]
MFSWYRRAQRCYIYLEDVPGGSTTDIIKQSRWFTRGWTLQELLAPRHVAFFDQSWTYIGCKTSSSWKTVQSPNEADQRFLNLISRITNIPESVLQRDTKLSDVSVARRMSWASHRQTTREEDLAYCLMGLFEVNLPIIYGEGLCKAFRRLQLEIMGQTTDQSIFAWDYSVLASDPLAILASSPAAFKHSSKVSVWGIRDQKPSGAFEMTNSGLQANFVLSDPKSPTPLALLECGLLHADRRHRLAIPLELYQKRQGNNLALYRRRTDLPPSSLKLFTWDSEGLKLTSLDFDAGSRDIIIMELRHYSHWKALVTNTGFN